MANKYDYGRIEEKWQRRWAEARIFESRRSSGGNKYYVLEMLPYPSGALHMGHVRNYSLGDSVARYRRMRGHDVLYTIGWDAFGLPAENAAIKNQIPPEKWTLDNIDRMRAQCKRMGWSYDWTREIASCTPEYYRWNQWFFIQMFKRGWAYKKLARVNWCEECQTVLANEQVEGGRCWRDGSKVVEKELEQWFWAITRYAEELLQELDRLEEWPEKVLTMQRNWIGRSTGAKVRFAIEDSEHSIEIFTTRLDTIGGATFLVLAPEHPLVAEWSDDPKHGAELAAFAQEMRSQDREARIAEEGEKRGVFTGRRAINPYTGERVPIWVANFVLLEYGTGAIMAVPAHDQRDFEFATKYDLPIRIVVESDEVDAHSRLDHAVPAYGTVINTGEFSGLSSDRAQQVMAEAAGRQGYGEAAVTYRLRDWGISRQRYWGTPIPMILCPDCGSVAVPEKDLPVLLPKVEGIPEGGSALASIPEFVEAACPKCGGPARRETDTMDTFVDSSWYFFRYADPHNDEAPYDPAIIRRWFPVDIYIGGIEHAVLHLIYMRFFCKVMRDLGLVEFDEPVTKLFTQGMVIKDGAKMSKSLGNVVSPDEVVRDHGADAIRLFIQVCAPPDGELDWNEKGLEGCSRFLRRLWRLLGRWEKLGSPDPGEARELSDQARQLLRKLHQTIRKVTQDLERMCQNTAISALMELLNAASAYAEGDDCDPAVLGLVLKNQALLLAPFAPHFAEEMWQRMGEESFISQAEWPDYDRELAREEEIQVVVQVNGKVRSKFSASPEISGTEMETLALEDERVKAHTAGKKVRKVIVVPKKLVNIVVGP